MGTYEERKPCYCWRLAIMYNTKEQDHEKRKNQEGSYSLYNYIYHYLMDNFAPEMDLVPAHELLFREAKAYDIKGGKGTPDDQIRETVKQAIDMFKQNEGKHGDTAHNLGKGQENSFDTVKRSLSDLRW